MRRVARNLTGAVIAWALAAGHPAAQPVAANATAPRPATVVYVVEQLITGPLTQGTLDRIKPLDTLQQIEDLLKASSIPFGWRRTELSTEAIPPGLAQQIAAMRPREVFAMPQAGGKGWVMNAVIGKR
jgi:hypothetical protein